MATNIVPLAMLLRRLPVRPLTTTAPAHLIRLHTPTCIRTGVTHRWLSTSRDEEAESSGSPWMVDPEQLVDSNESDETSTDQQQSSVRLLDTTIYLMCCVVQNVDKVTLFHFDLFQINSPFAVEMLMLTRLSERLCSSGGFTTAQADTIVACLQEAILDSMKTMHMSMIPKSDADQIVRAYKIDFAHLKSEIHLLEKNDFGILKQENERITGEVSQLKAKMREDLQLLQSSVMEEMNVDKMRVRDEQNVLKTKVNDTDARLESEIQNLRATIDEVRWETIKTVAAWVKGWRNM